MDTDKVKRRIKDRLFHTMELQSESSIQIGDTKASASSTKIHFRRKVKEFLERVPLAGQITIWLWRILNLPQWFYRLSRHFEGVVQEVNASIKKQESHETAIREIQNTLESFYDALNSISDQLQQFHASIKKQESHETAIREIQNTLESFTKTANIEESFVIHATPLIDPDEKNRINDINELYFTFENIFRGSETEIKKRQRKYLPYLMDAFNYTNRNKYFIDAGCGRGEFIKILKELKIPVKGVTINKSEYKSLKDEEIEVELIDINTYLERIGNDTLAGLVSFQMIEHLPEDYLKRFIDLSYRKITTNGLIILETINPKCSYALNNFFYLDLTHVRPYPPELLQFMLEWYGFKDIKIIYSSPSPVALRVNAPPEFNYLDYAVLGWKR